MKILNKHEKAIRELNDYYNQTGMNYDHVSNEAVLTAIEALEQMPEYERLKERDTAKKRVFDRGEGASCPGCKTYMKEVARYCKDCGQKINWEA